MIMKVIVFVCVSVLVSVQGKGIPSYLKTCPLKDPNFKQCAVDSANKALPEIVKGDREFGVPPLAPLHIPKIVIDSGGNGLKLEMMDNKVYGLDRMVFTDFKVLPNAMEIHFTIDKVEIISNYKGSGKVLILQLSGAGNSNVTAVGCKFAYIYHYKLTTKGDKVYALPDGAGDFKMDLQRAYFDFEHLVGGDLENHIKQFINDNWKDVLDDLGGALRQTISSIALSIFSGYFKKIPFSDLLHDV